MWGEGLGVRGLLLWTPPHPEGPLWIGPGSCLGLPPMVSGLERLCNILKPETRGGPGTASFPRGNRGPLSPELNHLALTTLLAPGSAKVPGKGARGNPASKFPKLSPGSRASSSQAHGEGCGVGTGHGCPGSLFPGTFDLHQGSRGSVGAAQRSDIR